MRKDNKAFCLFYSALSGKKKNHMMSLKTNSDYLFSHQVERALWHSAGIEKNTDVIVMSL